MRGGLTATFADNETALSGGPSTVGIGLFLQVFSQCDAREGVSGTFVTEMPDRSENALTR